VIEQLVTWDALQEMREEPPDGTRSGLAEMLTFGCCTVMLTLSKAVPPEPSQLIEKLVGLTVRGPVETPVELLVAPPVLNPVPVQEVALVEDHLKVEDWPESTVVGVAVRSTVGSGSSSEVSPPLEHPGSAGKSISPSPSFSIPSEHAAAAETVMVVHPPQLLFSSVSVIVPGLVAELLSAQARIYLVVPLSAVGKVYEREACAFPLGAMAVDWVCVPISCTLVAVSVTGLYVSARWKRFVKPESVVADPMFETVDWNVTAVPTVAEVGVMAPAVRSG